MTPTPFRIGQRVRMTEEAIQQRLDGPRKDRTGTVIAVGLKFELIRVKRDLHVVPGEYHPSFWQPL